ncbi:uncharacterized protein [Apostichopus japonicus]|uniref:uncharacterized protein isoform X2 n=1 Tax=Stichopus japonicus TaxID=307972 RepID=UPI003AB424A4
MTSTGQVVRTVHTTTTTTTATSTGSGLSFRLEYLTSIHGIALFLAMFYSLISFIVIIIGTNNDFLGGTYALYLTTSFFSFAYCLFTYLSLLTNLRSKMPLPWNLVDVFAYFILFVLMLISSSLVLAKGRRKAAGSAGTLGFIVVQGYFGLALLAIRDYRFSRSLTQAGDGATSNTPTGSMPSNLDPAY